MKFKILFFILFIFSCSPSLKTLNQKKPYSAKGFAYVYNENDLQNKIILGKLDNKKLQISHQNLKTGTLIKIINPKNNKSIILKNIKRIKYPDFYKVLITKPIFDELELSVDLPILEIIEIKKNMSFIAEKAKIFNEEKKIPSNAPVDSVKISNISKNKKEKIINTSKLYNSNIYNIVLKELIDKFKLKELLYIYQILDNSNKYNIVLNELILQDLINNFQKLKI